MTTRKPASLTAGLLARKGGATAAGFASSIPDSLDAGAAVATFVPTSAAPAREKRATHAFTRPRKALIVEDNELDLKLFRDLLEAQGFATLQARVGVDALRLAREQRPDLILVDADPPGGQGVECVAQIRGDERLRSIPLIVVTALAGEKQAGRPARSRDACLVKPVSVPEFLLTCARVCPALSA